MCGFNLRPATLAAPWALATLLLTVAVAAGWLTLALPQETSLLVPAVAAASTSAAEPGASPAATETPEATPSTKATPTTDEQKLTDGSQNVGDACAWQGN